jgi:hypothetical protein
VGLQPGGTVPTRADETLIGSHAGAAQEALVHLARCNAAASNGTYSADVEGT